MILGMQLGFALLEAGSVRAKNQSNILIKNIVDVFVCLIVFYLFGYGLANNLRGGVFGVEKFAGIGFQDQDYLRWVFEVSFCATATTIVSGAIAERAYVDTYIVYSMLMSGVIYPVASGWAWGGGWLQKLGYHDFSGSGVVHIIGGVAGLAGTMVIGPRLGTSLSKKDNSEEKEKC
jgi:Amt family ammonium transporter